MKTSVRPILAAAILAAGALLAAATVAHADCVSKAGKGTGSTDDDAKFQAWEAVLQATSWGSWANWMATSKTVGTAPGYKVSNLRSRCSAGGFLGRECMVGAKLCN